MKKKENEAAVVDGAVNVENVNGNMNVAGDPNFVMPAPVQGDPNVLMPTPVQGDPNFVMPGQIPGNPNPMMPGQVPGAKPKGKFGDFIKKNKLIFIIGGAVLALVLVTLLVYFLFFREKYIDYPILYLENGQLILWQEGNDEKIVVDSDYKEKNNASLVMAYANKTDNMFAYLNDGSLYLYNVKEKTNEKIASDVSKYSLSFTDTDEYLIYESEDDDIYSYNIKEKMKNKVVSIDEDDDEAFALIKYIIGNKVVYYVAEDDDDSYYSYKYTLHIKDLDTNTDNVITENYDSSIINEKETEIIYTKDDNEETMSLYKYNIKDNKNDKVLSGIEEILSNDDDYKEFIYYTKSETKVDILDDDELGKDPSTSTTKETYCTYSYYRAGYCTYEDWWYDRIVTITIVDSKKEVNDEIREAAEELEYYDIYKFKDGKTEKLASNVLEPWSANYESDTFVFTSLNTKDKVKISTLKSEDDFEAYLEKSIDVYYQVGKDNSVSLGRVDEVGDRGLVVTKDKHIYIINDDDELLFVDASKKETKLQLIEENVSGVYDGGFDFGVLYSVEADDTDDDFYDLYTINGKEKKEVAKNVESIVEYDVDNNKIYILNNCKKNSCDYSYYDGELHTLTNDVYDVERMTDKEFYVFKNYSSKNSTYDLYRYSDGELIQVAFDIKVGYTSVHEINDEK